MAEIVFILEPDTGRVTVESSQVSAEIAKEISRDLGQGINLNCARPTVQIENSPSETDLQKSETVSSTESIYLYRIYHYSTVDGPGRRSRRGRGRWWSGDWPEPRLPRPGPHCPSGPGCGRPASRW